MDDSWFEPKSPLSSIYGVEECNVVNFEYYAKQNKIKLLLHGADLDQNYFCSEDGTTLEEKISLIRDLKEYALSQEVCK